MTKAQRLIYAYLSQLGYFLGALPLLLVPQFLLVPGMYLYPAFLLLAFTAVFVIKETGLPRLIRVLLIIAVPLVFGAASMLFFASSALVFTWFSFGVIVLLAALIRDREYNKAVYDVALILHSLAFLAQALPFVRVLIEGVGFDSFWTALLVYIALVLIFRTLCLYFKGLDETSRANSFEHQPKEETRRFFRRSRRLFFGLFGVIFAFVLAFAIWGFDVDITIGGLDVNQQRDLTLQRYEERRRLVQDQEEILDFGVDYYWAEADPLTALMDDTFMLPIFGGGLLVVILLGIHRAMRISKRRKKAARTYTPEEIEEEAIAPGPRFRRRGAERLSTNRQVRRLFKKKVVIHRRKGLTVQQSDTPRKISDKIRPDEDLGPLTALYHQARYSSQKVPRSALTAIRGGERPR